MGGKAPRSPGSKIQAELRALGERSHAGGAHGGWLAVGVGGGGGRATGLDRIGESDVS